MFAISLRPQTVASGASLPFSGSLLKLSILAQSESHYFTMRVEAVIDRYRIYIIDDTYILPMA